MTPEQMLELDVTTYNRVPIAILTVVGEIIDAV